jgi:type I restriction enzyme S subunit
MSGGWAIKSLSELCEAPKLRKAEVGTVPYIEIGDVDVVSKLVNLKDKPAVKGSVLAPASSLLVSRVRPTRGAITLLNGTQAVSSAFVALQPKAGINLRLLFYWLAYSDDFRAYLENAQIGSLYPSVREEDILKYHVNYPSDPAEQQRIVRLLDEAFKGIGIAQANAETNLQNARALFESHLRASVMRKENGWAEVELGSIGQVEMCKRILKQQTNSISGIPFYKIGTFGKTADAFIPLELFKDYRARYSYPKKGDILLSAAGTIGRRVAFNGEPAYFQDSNIVWVANSERVILNSYLYYFYGACDFNPSKGTTINRLYNDDLRRLVVYFPPSLDAQSRVVDQLNELGSATEYLTRLYSRKLVQLKALKQSLLERAFAGELEAA